MTGVPRRGVRRDGELLLDGKLILAAPFLRAFIVLRFSAPATSAIADTVKRVEQGLVGNGRLLVRYSGTEPLLRIMLEGQDQGTIRVWADEIATAVHANLA